MNVELQNDLIYFRNYYNSIENNNNKLGKGNFGSVFKISPRNNGIYYAIKIIKNDEKRFIHIKREIKIMSGINHKNITKMYDYFCQNEKYYLVLEYLPNGTLNDKINDKINNSGGFHRHFQENEILNIFHQIISGLNYLHDLNIAHRDIKPDNILFDKKNNVKLSDFGYSVLLNNYPINEICKKNPDQDLISSGKTKIGHKDYSAPELINGKPVDSKCDIFSLGMTIFYLMSFKLPFISTIDEEEIHRYYNENILNDFKGLDIYSIELRNLVMKMINKDPGKRPSSGEVSREIINIMNKYNQIPKDIIIFSNNNQNGEVNCSNTNYHFQNEINCNYSNNNENDKVNNANNENEKINSNSNNNNNDDTEILDNNFYSKEKSLFISIITCIVFLEDLPKAIFNINSKEKTILKKNIKDLTDTKFNEFFPSLEISEDIIESYPFIVFKEIINKFSKKFKEKNTNWKNKLFNAIIRPKEIDDSEKEDIISKKVINKIGEDYREKYDPDPFIDLFYFINLDFYKCGTCGKINTYKKNISVSLTIKVKDENKSINDLIKNYFITRKTNNKEQCETCNFNTEVKEKLFVTLPSYLVIKFENENKEQIIFDDEIDLDSYTVTYYNPTKYNFYALIIEEEFYNNKHYIAVIKHNDYYELYSDNVIQICGEEVKTYGSPIIAIYKRQKK